MLEILSPQVEKVTYLSCHWRSLIMPKIDKYEPIFQILSWFQISTN